MGRPRKEYVWGEEIKNGIIFLEELEGYSINQKTTFERRVKVKCPKCGNIFITLLRKITRSSGNVTQCQECSKKDTAKRCRANGYATQHNLLGQRFGKLVVIDRVFKENSSGSLWKCQCDCGNITTVTGGHLVQGNTVSCGCIKSKGEELITKLLINNDISFQKEKIFQDCFNPKTNKKLRFDFYLPNYNCCIEYDGEQHYNCKKKGWNSSSHLKETQYKDNIKNQYCKNNGIKLIRIPYTDYNKLNEEYILNLL